MNLYLFVGAVIIILGVVFKRISNKLGVPVLLMFIALGVIFGSSGIIRIPSGRYEISEAICETALLFIMFYGGFGTSKSEARPVFAKSVLMSTVGTVLTAAAVGLFCRFVLKMKLAESFLIGSVISSTDAASVFSVLRSKHLNLKHNTASLLEVESGSNDPTSYLLTLIMLMIMNGEATGASVFKTVFLQVSVGLLGGAAIAYIAVFFFKKFRFFSAGFDAVFLVAIAILSFSLPRLLGGNGYLSVYITGMILGNRRIANKTALVNFFDGLTGLMQMLLFFLLGLLIEPQGLMSVAVPALAVAVFLAFVARPAAAFLVLTPLGAPVRQTLLVAWSGLRGAASIVFALIAVIHPAHISCDLFNIVFVIVLFSIAVQGTLLPLVAKKLKMTDGGDVMKTFTDYTKDHPVRFIRFAIPENHALANRELRHAHFPPETIVALIIRNGKRLVPNGKMHLLPGDTVILAGSAIGNIGGVHLREKIIENGDEWEDKRISEIKTGEDLIIMIQRGENIIIPRGGVKVRSGDMLVLNSSVPQAGWEEEI